MIDFTPQLAEAYSRLIEAPGLTQDQIDYEAIQILRGLTAADLSEVLFDEAETIKSHILGNRPEGLGEHINGVVWAYCRRVAERKLS